MKKDVIKISLAFVIISAIVLIWLGLRLIDGDGTTPSYSFLGGRSPVACRDVKKGSVDKCYIYSFEGDFNDVCSKAEVELFPMGFVVRALPGDVYWEYTSLLREIFHRHQFNIRIYNNHMYIEKEDAIGPKDGWILIEIGYWQSPWMF